MTEGDREFEKAFPGRSALDVFPMTGAETACPRCDLQFNTLLHPFCQHRHCPPRELSAGKEAAKATTVREAVGDRRARADLQSPVEHRASDLIWAIEKMGAHPLLTEAQQKAMEAHELLVRWHVEGEPGGNTKRYEPCPGDEHHERFVAKVPS